MQPYMSATIEMIDPEQAFKYLSTAIDNRDIRQAKVSAFASAMKAGLWHLTHQGIAFDRDGRLVDGNHRLWAIVESKLVIKMLVARGVEKDSVSAIDTGTARTYADYGHYNGGSTDPLTGSLAKILALGIGNQFHAAPHDRVQGWYEFYKQSIDFSIKLRHHTRGAKTKVMTVAMAGAFAAAYWDVGEEVLSRIAEVLRTGTTAFDADRAAIALRDAWLMKRLGVGMTEQYYKTEGAIRAFKERRPIKNLQRVESEVFSIPKLPNTLRYTVLNTQNSPRSNPEARAQFKLSLVGNSKKKAAA